MTLASHARSDAPGSVAVFGLGSMGAGIAHSLARAGLPVRGFDPSSVSADRFRNGGGHASASAREAAHGAGAAVSVVVNADQTEALLFGPDGIAESLAPSAVFVSCATMDPARARALAARFESTGRHYLDAPMSGGPVRAEAGDLSVMASGSPGAFAAAAPVLDAMAGTVHRLGDAAGAGSAFKMINQLLAGVHIAAACEAIAFAARQDLDLARVYEVITASAGNSWMFENRVPHVLEGDYAPRSAVEIFVKDLGIVQDMARGARFPVPVAGAALQMFLAASGAGMGGDDDASLARVYAALSGATLPEPASAS